MWEESKQGDAWGRRNGITKERVAQRPYSKGLGPRTPSGRAQTVPRTGSDWRPSFTQNVTSARIKDGPTWTL
jgi:hypothetical protein